MPVEPNKLKLVSATAWVNNNLPTATDKLDDNVGVWLPDVTRRHIEKQHRMAEMEHDRLARRAAAMGKVLAKPEAVDAVSGAWNTTACAVNSR